MILAIAGCSGTGKTVITKFLVDRFNFKSPIHTTTRRPRKDDNGFYKYVTIEQFNRMYMNEEFFYHPVMVFDIME